MWQNCVLTLSLTLPYLRNSINHIHEDNRRFLLIGGKTVKIGNICYQPLLSFTFDLQRYQIWVSLSVYHHTIICSTYWRLPPHGPRIGSRVIPWWQPCTLPPHYWRRRRGGQGDTAPAERGAGARALAREFLDWSGDWGSGHRQMLTISHQHSGVRTRAGRACSSVLLDILHYYTLMQARNTVTSYLPFFLHLPTSFYSGKGFQKTELVFYIQLKWLKCWQREKLLEYIE